MDLSLETRTEGAWTVIAVSGELDLYTVTPLKEALVSSVAQGAVRIAIDLSDVGFMDSSSLGILVAALKRAREKDGNIALIGVHGSPAKVLSLTGLDAVFVMAPTFDALPSA
jgi:anti-sigma B factor antagonist